MVFLDSVASIHLLCLIKTYTCWQNACKNYVNCVDPDQSRQIWVYTVSIYLGFETLIQEWEILHFFEQCFFSHIGYKKYSTAIASKDIQGYWGTIGVNLQIVTLQSEGILLNFARRENGGTKFVLYECLQDSYGICGLVLCFCGSCISNMGRYSHCFDYIWHVIFGYLVSETSMVFIELENCHHTVWLFILIASWTIVSSFDMFESWTILHLRLANWAIWSVWSSISLNPFPLSDAF